VDNLEYDLMRILITGAQGFLGGSLFNLLNTNSGEIIPTGRKNKKNYIKCNLVKKKEVNKLISNSNPEIIIHCAATVPKKKVDYNKSIYQDDLIMLSNIISESSCPIFFISSMTVYGNYLDKPALEKDSLKPISSYAKMKLKCENLLKSSKRAGFAIRIPGLFGLPRKSGIIYNTLYSLKYKKDIKLPDYPLLWASMHIDDAILSISKLVENNINNFQSINVGYSEKYSINLLVQKINRIFNKNIEYDIVHPTFKFDLNQAKLHGIEPLNSLETAINTFYKQI